MKNIYRVHLPLFITNFFYGINFTLAKIVTPSFIQPYGFVLLRILGAGFLFTLLFFIFRMPRVEKKDLKHMLTCSLFGVVINQLLFIKGLSLTTPIHAALIMLTTPVLVLVISRIAAREQVNYLKTLGILLAMLGAFLLIGLGKELGTGVNTLLGDILIFLNATSYAIYLVIAKPMMSKYKSLTMVTYLFAMAAPFALLVGSTQLAAVQWQHTTPQLIGCIASVVIGATFLAYLLNNYALQHTSPSTVGAYIYLQPFIAAVMAIFIAHEPITWIKVLSSILIFTGIYLVNTTRTLPTPFRS